MKRTALFKSFNLSLFTSLVCLDAPALLTASTRSVTLGCIFQFYLGLTNLLRFLQLRTLHVKNNSKKLKPAGMSAFRTKRLKSMQVFLIISSLNLWLSNEIRNAV